MTQRSLNASTVVVLLLALAAPLNAANNEAKPNAAVAIESAVSSKGFGDSDFDTCLEKHLRRQGAFTVPDDAKNPALLGPLAQGKRLKRLVVNATLISLEKQELAGVVAWVAVVSFMVLDFPGHAIKAMQTNRASVGRNQGEYRPELDTKLKARAVDEALRLASDALAERIREI